MDIKQKHEDVSNWLGQNISIARYGWDVSHNGVDWVATSDGRDYYLHSKDKREWTKQSIPNKDGLDLFNVTVRDDDFIGITMRQNKSSVIQKSKDGINWSPTFIGTPCSKLFVLPTDNVLALNIFGEMYLSKDLETWKKLPNLSTFTILITEVDNTTDAGVIIKSTSNIGNWQFTSRDGYVWKIKAY